jgi:predicted negative regulator of RcsB-dependent stress response
MSSNRLTRSEVKRNELTEGIEASVDFVRHYARWLVIAVGSVAILGLLVLGVRQWRQSAEERASAAFDLAQRAFAGEIVAADAKPLDPRHPSFSSDEARRARAQELFEGVRSRYGSTQAGAVASVYLGRLAVDRGDLDGARKLWSEYLERESDGMLAAAVTLDLARLWRAQGQGEKAVKELEALLATTDRVVPEDAALYELGVTLGALGRGDEGKAHLQRILSEFPRSSYREAAQREISGGSGGS